MQIQSFRCGDTEKLWQRTACHATFRPFMDIAMRKLAMINRAGALNDLRIPPGNQLEALKGDRKGQHSIRINKQWRICFRWPKEASAPSDVEIVDYH